MTTTKIYNGQIVTLSGTEVDYEPEGGFDHIPLLVQGEVRSGTIYAGTGPAGGSPIINGSLGSWGSYDTTNTKFNRTVEPGKTNLRLQGTGTVIISW